ncbi:hypothetical protein OG539_28055 [Actinacidiphila glaucinigra]|uniref:restriction endonuclease n=1 Tax=Actinacidiphila glaucinigra TaxID=235986 RepID=UPI002DDC27AD|nr:hypothetical protein [Actinacidiphila glaucinigra]WSD60109.1 hypothetical protein OIE69_14845 [Actinacidiphila glaucinigra]
MRKGAITRQSVLKAIAEYDKLGREAFLSKYGFGKARTYVLEYEGREYDAKAIAGAAHRWDQGRALRSSEFSGGKAHAVTWLERLEFRVAGGVDDFSELEFTSFLVRLLNKSGYWNVSQDVLLGPGARADIIAESQDSVIVVEAKRVSPQTNLRIEDAVNQLQHYGELTRTMAEYRDRTQRLAVAAPGILATTSAELFTKSGVEIWDGKWLAQRSVAAGLRDEASKFLDPEYFDAAPESEALELTAKLTNMPAGRGSWSAYQRLCRDIAEYLFCPPLESPAWESLDDAEMNRRDFILPNYAETGFWKFIRDKYFADYVVTDAKNFTHGIEKREVLQVANYLSKHGTGLFALIVTRVDPQESAVHAIKSQWMQHDKMIVTLTDADVVQMLAVKSFGNDPSEVIRQKIEDFRLGV